MAQIIKIEGVFSGTLSYIFNEFSKVEGGDVKFSEVVKTAKDKGYTVSPPSLSRENTCGKPFVTEISSFVSDRVILGTRPKGRPLRFRRREETDHPLPSRPRLYPPALDPPRRIRVPLYPVARPRRSGRM
jgi:hypothetical protein